MTDLFHGQERSLNRALLRFDEAATEAAYVRVHNRRALTPLRIAIVLFALAIAVPTLVELYGFYQEGWHGYDSWLGLLPYRLGAVALLVVSLGLTFVSRVHAHGQFLVGAILSLLMAILFLAESWYGPWILLVAPVFNFGLTLAIVASGLLIRYAAPLVLLASGGWLLVLMRWTENAFATGFLALATALTMIAIGYARERAERLNWAAGLALREEKALSDKLLLNVLPPSIADRLRAGETLIADRHEDVAVVFADIVNFTPLSASMPPQELVTILDDIFTRFDHIAAELNLEKIKTIGDAYMMAAGLPVERAPDPGRALLAALRMREAVAGVSSERGIAIDIRAGVHLGEVVAGVIGHSKFVYDLWGDVVNVASRMESTAPRGAIQVTEEVYRAMHDRFQFQARGEIEVKGKGGMHTWLLNGPR